MAEENCEDKPMFTIQKDRFSCITLDSTKVEFDSAEEFGVKLANSLQTWREAGIRGVWVRVDIEHAQLVPVVTQAGFVFHHAKADYVMLKSWISPTEAECLPGFATHYVGCAGLVINSRGQVLAIQERFHEKKIWKLPGGLADPGEEIFEAAAREVREETGVEAEFDYLLTLRHQHRFHFGMSDLYFVCVMRALSEDIHTCQVEIHDARWMEIDEYLSHKSLTDSNRFIMESYKASLSQPRIHASPVLSHNKQAVQQIYSVVQKGQS